MIKQLSKLLSVTFLSLLLVIQGCTSTRQVANVGNPNSVLSQLKTGDEVVITTKSGEKYQIVITSVTKEKITGGDREVALADISQVEIKKTEVVKTSIGIGLTLFFVIGLISMGKFMSTIFKPQ